MGAIAENSISFSALSTSISYVLLILTENPLTPNTSLTSWLHRLSSVISLL